MVTLTVDPLNPNRLILTQAVTLYLDKVLLESLSAELTEAIRQQAVTDITHNKIVRKQIAVAATQMLLRMLGAAEEPKT